MDRRNFIKNIFGLGVSSIVPSISNALPQFDNIPSIIRDENLYPTIVFFLDIHEDNPSEDTYFEKDYELLINLFKLNLKVIGIEGLTQDKRIIAGEIKLIEKLVKEKLFTLVPLESSNFDIKKADEIVLSSNLSYKKNWDILIKKQNRSELLDIVFTTYKKSNFSFPSSINQSEEIDKILNYCKNIENAQLREKIFTTMAKYMSNLHVISSIIKSRFNEEPTFENISKYEKKLALKYPEIFSGEIKIFDSSSRDKYNDFLIHQREIYASKIVYDYIIKNNLKNFILFFGEGHKDTLVHLIDNHFKGKVNWIFIKN